MIELNTTLEGNWTCSNCGRSGQVVISKASLRVWERATPEQRRIVLGEPECPICRRPLKKEPA